MLSLARKYLTPSSYIEPSTRAALGPEVDYVEGDAGAIPLPDGSVDRISAHHFFEHFQGDSDTGFIREVQRLLAPEGRCCIVPLFVAKRYVEITNQVSSRYRFDSRSRRVVDPTATIPGSGYSGHYARIYDVPALQRRILDAIDPSRFELGIYQLTMEGRPLPDMSLECHRAVTGASTIPIALSPFVARHRPPGETPEARSSGARSAWRKPGPRTLSSVCARVCHLPMRGSRRLSSGAGVGTAKLLAASSVTVTLLPSTQRQRRP
jgi:hypothetical protein